MEELKKVEIPEALPFPLLKAKNPFHNV